MKPLFEHLICKKKIRRWFNLLNLLEQDEYATLNTLAKKTNYTRRTILNDVQELKAYFDCSILWIGDETGYHFSLQDPNTYEQKKRALLAEEQFFFFFDCIASGQELSNAQWAKKLNVSSASFGRMKHQFQSFLTKQYKVKLDAKNNFFVGEEVTIRQLLYDFYFSLPVYPEVAIEKIKQLCKIQTRVQKGAWQIDEKRMNQWIVIAQLRITQRCELKKNEETSLQKMLVRAFNYQVTISLPNQEKAALFLLSLKEEQFLNPMLQKRFLREFSLPNVSSYMLIQTDEELASQFLSTYLSLMHLFFQLLPCHKSRVIRQKEFYYKSLYVTYRLSGSNALKRWIKKEVESELLQAGWLVVNISAFDKTSYQHFLEVSNLTEINQKERVLKLSQFPRKEEIQKAISRYFA
ncbi:MULTISPECIES: HTH domain-containing protein [Enterococcus]|uniref:Cation transport ATPase n=4 Tax=Enterococcus mundtii TaxID=53346 RepID=A0AAI8RCT5_ENTMU|nr:helix-turn-helix domain containing protein [Enterococcus mundtii]QCJ57941.1 M protein trans-acting positive regulator [Enterococcus mundtii]UBM07148.1 HTH domain-containing protein [Enterococcus mundtii]BBM16353.1 cation transport ATPase [Enterococcus mundtii]